MRPLVLLDGDPGPELGRRGVALRPSPGALPLPIREPVAFRTVLRDSALAGADTVTAPTGSLHRRALARNGAARRSLEWISAAVALAREAAAEAEDAGRSARGDDPAPPLRIAALVLPLEGAGRPDLAPDASAAYPEHVAHAGMLAESGAGILRIEQMGTIAESDAATRAAVETGLTTWTGVELASEGRSLASGEPLEAWADAIATHPVDALLLSAPAVAALEEAIAILRSRTTTALGAAIPAAGRAPDASTSPGLDEAVRRVVAAGASLVSPADGSPMALAEARRTIDGIAAERAAADLAAADRARAWVETVARRFPAGRALWVGRAPEQALPARFAWDVVPELELARLPADRYVVAVAAGVGRDQARRLVGALEPGGWLLVAAARDVLAGEGRLESIEPVEPPEPGRESWIARRRP